MTKGRSLLRHARSRVLAAALLAVSPAVYAQPLLPYDGPELPLVVASTNQSVDARHVAVTLRNEGETAVHAYIFTAEHRSRKTGRVVGQYVDAFDAHYYARHDPIQPGGERQIRIGAPPPPLDANTTFGVQAVVLADGSAFGSAYWIGSISKRRSAALESIGQAIGELRLAALAGSRQPILDQMTANRERQKALDSGKSGVERNASDLPYDMVIRTLESLPPAEVEQRSSTDLGFIIENIVASLNAQRQRITSAVDIHITSQ